MSERVQMVGNRLDPTRLIEEPDSIENPILAFFLDYWIESRGTAALPLRTSFLPQRVRGNLPWVVTSDALPDLTDFRYRVVGSRVAEYFLGDAKGKTIREGFAGVDGMIEATLWLYQRVCSQRIPIRLTGPASTYETIYFPKYDALYLPYSSDGEHADRVVNVFTFNHSEIVRRTIPSNSRNVAAIV